jgi:retinol dehydrogenase-12
VISTYMLAALIAPLLQKTSKLPDPNPVTPLKPHLVIVASDGTWPLRARLHPLSEVNL